MIKNIWHNQVYFNLLLFIIAILMLLTITLQINVIPSLKKIAYEDTLEEAKKISHYISELSYYTKEDIIVIDTSFKKLINDFNNNKSIKAFDEYSYYILKANILIVFSIIIVFLILIYLISAQNLKEQKLISRDYLTNLYNRRYFYEIVEKFLHLSKREKSPISLCLIDIDNFKRINDTYGHNNGDEVLKTFAEETKELIRKSDVLVRFGGEEFLLLLPNTSLNNAEVLSSKICKHFEKLQVSIKFTVSIGIAVHDGKKDIDELINDADKALYIAKESGKNRVVKYSDDLNRIMN